MYISRPHNYFDIKLINQLTFDSPTLKAGHMVKLICGKCRHGIVNSLAFEEETVDDLRSICPACRGTKKTSGTSKCPWCLDSTVSLELAVVYWRVRAASPFEYASVFGSRVMEDKANIRKGIPVVRIPMAIKSHSVKLLSDIPVVSLPIATIPLSPPKSIKDINMILENIDNGW